MKNWSLFFFALFLIFLPANRSEANTCKPSYRIDVKYSTAGGTDIRAFRFVNPPDTDAFVSAFRKAITSFTSLEDVITAPRRQEIYCGGNNNTTLLNSRQNPLSLEKPNRVNSFSTNARASSNLDITICYMDGIGQSFDCETGSGEGAEPIDEFDCQTEKTSAGIITTCSDGSGGIYLSNGEVVVSAETKRVEQALVERTDYMKSLANDMKIFITRGYDPRTTEQKNAYALSREQFEKYMSELRSRIDQGKPTESVSQTIDRINIEAKRSNLSQQLISSYEANIEILKSLSISASELSPAQAKRFVNRYAREARQLEIAVSIGGEKEQQYRAEKINGLLKQAAGLSEFSPNFASEQAAIENLVERYSNNGIVGLDDPIYPAEVNLNTDPFSSDRDERSIATNIRQAINNAMIRSKGAEAEAIVFGFASAADYAYVNGNFELANELIDLLYINEDFQAGYGSDYPVNLNAQGQGFLGQSISGEGFIPYLVAELANQISEYTSNLSAELEFQSRLYLRSALSGKEHGSYDFAVSMLLNAVNMKVQMAGFGVGLIKGVYSTVDGIIQVVSSPVESIEALVYAIENFDQTLEAITKQVYAKIDEIPAMTPYERSVFAGEVTAIVVETFYSGGALASGKLTTKISSAVKTVTTKVIEPIAKTYSGYRRLTRRRHTEGTRDWTLEKLTWRLYEQGNRSERTQGTNKKP